MNFSDGIRVADLFVYPIKSCGGIAVETAEVDAFGFRNDRRWMVVDESGRFLTQRTVPLLATIRAGISDGQLFLRAAGWDSLAVDAFPETAAERVIVWRDTVDALPIGGEAAAWLTSVLGRPARLVWMPDSTVRPAKHDPAGSSPRISFADAYSFLLVSRASLEALNTRLVDPLPMNRFRPNIVVEGAGPFAEDDWKVIRIGEIELDAAGPCARCATTTTDQETGARGLEPLQTLATFRREGNEVFFGQNANHRGTGTIRRGDPVEVVSTG
ncbi:MAG TPA: MOSC N-terminal beta barrel domain-containing protein [Gemmatimonadota bacterium]|nr:MOSC N-terminal beta barrel domain-containing protein [Gemmatimonadota bacterium]